MTGVKFDRCGESQKTIVTIEFTALTLCWVRNFIKIEAFAVLRPKLWPDRWQVPTLTGVINYKKLLPPMNSPPSICEEYKISSKLKHLLFFVQNYGLKDDSANIGRYQESQKTIAMNEFSTFKLFSMQSFVENCSPHSPFPVPHLPFPVSFFKDGLKKYQIKEHKFLYFLTYLFH